MQWKSGGSLHAYVKTYSFMVMKLPGRRGYYWKASEILGNNRYEEGDCPTQREAKQSCEAVLLRWEGER